MNAGALARSQYAPEIVRILYAVEYDYERRLVSLFRKIKDLVERAVSEVGRVPDTALMVRAVRRLVERGATFKLYRYAAPPTELEYLRNAFVVRAARYYIDTVEAAARFQPFENGVFSEDLDKSSSLLFL